MNSSAVTSCAVGTGILVTTGTWAEGGKLTPRIAVGTVFLALGLSAMSEMNAGIAGKFAILVLLAAMFRYTLPILYKTGLVETPKKAARK